MKFEQILAEISQLKDEECQVFSFESGHCEVSYSENTYIVHKYFGDVMNGFGDFSKTFEDISSAAKNLMEIPVTVEIL